MDRQRKAEQQVKDIHIDRQTDKQTDNRQASKTNARNLNF